MYSLLPSSDAPGLACFAVRATGGPSSRSAERFLSLEGSVLCGSTIRLLLVGDGAGDAWATLAAALAGRSRVQRLALVGIDGSDSAERRHYAAEDQGTAWSWLRGAVPPVPAWGAPLLPAYAPAPLPAEQRPAVATEGRPARPLEKAAPMWPVRQAPGSTWEVPTEVLLADEARRPGVLRGGYRGEW